MKKVFALELTFGIIERVAGETLQRSLKIYWEAKHSLGKPNVANRVRAPVRDEEAPV